MAFIDDAGGDKHAARLAVDQVLTLCKRGGGSLAHVRLARPVANGHVSRHDGPKHDGRQAPRTR